MVDVLGSLACNDDKFSLWFINGKALGFNWSLLDGTLSMPSEKITKARTRVLEVINGTHTTRHQLDQLLGSLRHVTTCVRPAAAFFQRVATLHRSATRYGRVKITEDVRDDLRWFLVILKIAPLNGVAFDRFVDRVDPDFTILMDACDVGLCAAFPARKEYVLVQFDEEELGAISELKHQTNDFDINVRARTNRIEEALEALGALLRAGALAETSTKSYA
ncbi:hypothetical protein PHYSODRAFT_336290 [Phytophthora sojae]|uniref:Uncharacterized protein n=1 Tax=Phytophthora sojae (strain P6497) TaxID=1094619 RepID=G4ZX78_PHYSP|nr:hypothetical protein PHYSODRAFT_336290 [Phytophthora sojae]EGZ11795.1 hypothetical protein PHYSODRAFT_336290 [Phytophthora sojae]|eukprot:XP_009532128.1 hypothetical protein PHYSODRAFT_336290 [Phytophthora sojae]